MQLKLCWDQSAEGGSNKSVSALETKTHHQVLPGYGGENASRCSTEHKLVTLQKLMQDFKYIAKKLELR